MSEHQNKELLDWALEYWLKPRAALISDRIKASKGQGWPRGKRRAPFTSLEIEAVDALTLYGDFSSPPPLPASIIVIDGSETVAEYELREGEDAEVVVVKEASGSADGGRYAVREAYDLRALGRLKQAMDNYAADGDGLAYLVDVAAAWLVAAREGWVTVYPEPDWLEGLHGAAARTGDLDLDRARGWLGERRPGRTVAWQASNLRLALGGDASQRNELSSRRGAEFELCAPLWWVKDIVSRSSGSSPTPAGREEFLEYLLGRIKEYGVNWRVRPGPLMLHPWLRTIAGTLGIRYDLEMLDHVNLARIATQGLALAVGWHSRHVLIIRDGPKVSDAILVELLQGGIEKVASLEVLDWPEFPPPGEAREEWMADRQYALWDQVGWTNYLIAMDGRLLKTYLSIAKASLSSSPLGYIGALRPLLDLQVSISDEDLSVWPVEATKDLAGWVEREGVGSILLRLSRAVFRRRSRMSRGLLYVRETVLAALALIVLIALLAGLR